MYNTISSVDPGSPLEGRVLPGDELRYINRHEIHDVLDYKYWAYDRSLTLEFRDAGTIRAKRCQSSPLKTHRTTAIAVCRLTAPVISLRRTK